MEDKVEKICFHIYFNISAVSKPTDRESMAILIYLLRQVPN